VSVFKKSLIVSAVLGFWQYGSWYLFANFTHFQLPVLIIMLIPMIAVYYNFVFKDLPPNQRLKNTGIVILNTVLQQWIVFWTGYYIFESFTGESSIGTVVFFVVYLIVTPILVSILTFLLCLLQKSIKNHER